MQNAHFVKGPWQREKNRLSVYIAKIAGSRTFGVRFRGYKYPEIVGAMLCLQKGILRVYTPSLKRMPPKKNL